MRRNCTSSQSILFAHASHCPTACYRYSVSTLSDLFFQVQASNRPSPVRSSLLPVVKKVLSRVHQFDPSRALVKT